jgi:hypothetical protein
MSKYALVEPSGRVAQVEANENDTFPVADPFRWLECGDEVDITYRYEDGEFLPTAQEMID